MNYNFNDDKKFNVKKILISALKWIIQIVIVVALAYFITRYTVEKTTTVGTSMEGTLMDGDKIIVNKFAYRFTQPSRFDIIVFKQSGKEHSFYNIKRIIGLPGETVQIKDGSVYINGEKLEEMFKMEPMLNGGLAEELVTLEDKEYFVLGDNRNNSEDSRFANVNNILKEDIIGKAWLRLNPFGFVSSFEPNQKEIEQEVE